MVTCFGGLYAGIFLGWIRSFLKSRNSPAYKLRFAFYFMLSYANKVQLHFYHADMRCIEILSSNNKSFSTFSVYFPIYSSWFALLAFYSIVKHQNSTADSLYVKTYLAINLIQILCEEGNNLISKNVKLFLLIIYEANISNFDISPRQMWGFAAFLSFISLQIEYL